MVMFKSGNYFGKNDSWKKVERRKKDTYDV